MIFTLEALKAANGDSLILHYGEPVDPRFILIDGGPTKSGYREVLLPRLTEIKEQFSQDAPLPLEMMMVSHIDDDHIDGLLALTADMLDRVQDGEEAPFAIRTLWFNSFDDLLDNDDEEVFSALTAKVRAAGVDAPLPGFGQPDRYGAAVIASVGQGRRLRADAAGLDIPVNAPFQGLVMVTDAADRRVDYGDGLQLTIVAPDEARIRALQKKWSDEVRASLSEERLADVASAGGSRDTSVANLSSIVVLAEAAGKRILLTGDALDVDIVEGLASAGLLNNGTCHVDVLKLPHHGSDRNVSAEFFAAVTADHYVVSGDGRHGNPEMHTLELLEASRGDSDQYQVHLTYRDGKEELGERLDAFLDGKPAGRYRFRDNAARSLKVDLAAVVDY